MTTTRAAWFSLLLLVVPAPLAAQGGVAGCPREEPPGAVAFDTSRVAGLAGTFDVVLVDTAVGRGQTRVHRGRLTLGVPTGSDRAKWPLVGSYASTPPDTGGAWRTMEHGVAGAPGVVWRDGSLRLGEMGDPEGINLTVLLASPGELRGTWTGNSGLGVVIDYTGTRRREPAGYFCARRAG